MLKQECNYGFRKRMLEIYEKNIRNGDFLPENDELVLNNGLEVCVYEAAGTVTYTAAQDLTNYLFISMGVSSMLKKGRGSKNYINLYLAGEEGVDLAEAKGYRGFQITVQENGISIYGNDERGIAQAVYYIEDLMTFRKAPYLKLGTTRLKPMFSTQMVHSGYGLDEYPNEHLATIAHDGRDAILVFVKDVNITPGGYLDFNELIYRAAGYGLDVYAYSYLKSEKHPDDPDAEAYYESNYGRLFKECPGLKGITLVGESVAFPSKDPHTVYGRPNFEKGEIPTDKYNSGWYPCSDYPDWLNLIKKIVRKYKSDAEIVFWTYNWGFQPEEERIKLIKSLPTDITLQATFEMFQQYDLDGVKGESADYTLTFAQYGSYFKSEAEEAKRRGIKLNSMTNSSGLTWDFGVVPFLPFPHQWILRYQAMREAHDKWGLAGVMECHHYGFYPSIISKLSKFAYYEPRLDMDRILITILQSEYGNDNADAVNEALKLWSKAITYYTPTDADQYGAFRVGPSYPFCLEAKINLPDTPNCMFGNRICFPTYFERNDGRIGFTSIRIHKEIASLQKMKQFIEQGLEILRGISSFNDKLLYLINLGEFLYRTIITGIHAKQWHNFKCILNLETDKRILSETLDTMEQLLVDERENAERTIPLVQLDSRLGWEPSMGYMTDEKHLRWKLRQVDYVLNVEIFKCRKSLSFS